MEQSNSITRRLQSGFMFAKLKICLRICVFCDILLMLRNWILRINQEARYGG